MLTAEQKAFFFENGYISIPNVLSPEIVAELRSKILTIFKTNDWKKVEYNTEQVLCNIFNSYPEFVDVVLNKTLIDAVQSLLNSTPVLFPETAIHYKFYTGWHKDSTSIEKSGEKFHLNENAMFLQCGYYLQDNNELGGGLTVMPKSHQTTDNFINPNSYSLSILDRIKLKLGSYSDEKNIRLNPNKHSVVDVPTKAGDLVIFNFKLNHSATFPKKIKPESVPFEQSKIAVFNAFSNDTENANKYFDFITKREEPFYQSLKEYKPSQELLNTAEKLNFKVVK